jgi:hypothetical protein
MTTRTDPKHTHDGTTRKSRTVIKDGKEYTEFTSFKGKSTGVLVRVPRRKCIAKHAQVAHGEFLVGPICQSKHGKRRVMFRRRGDAGKCGSLLHATNMTAVVKAQNEGIMLHFVDSESTDAYQNMLFALSRGGAEDHEGGNSTSQNVVKSLPP